MGRWNFFWRRFSVCPSASIFLSLPFCPAFTSLLLLFNPSSPFLSSLLCCYLPSSPPCSSITLLLFFISLLTSPLSCSFLLLFPSFLLLVLAFFSSPIISPHPLSPPPHSSFTFLLFFLSLLPSPSILSYFYLPPFSSLFFLSSTLHLIYFPFVSSPSSSSSSLLILSSSLLSQVVLSFGRRGNHSLQCQQGAELLSPVINWLSNKNISLRYN